MADKRKVGAEPPASQNTHSVSKFSVRLDKKPKLNSIAAPVAGFADDTEIETTEYVLGFDSDKIQSTAPKKKTVELVIPLQKPNSYAKPKPKPAVENGDGPAVTPTEGGDAAASGAGAAKPGDDGKLDVELSLEERAIKALNDNASKFGKEEEEEETLAVPLLMQNRVPGHDDLGDEKEQYLNDVASRPDEASMDEYETVPIMSFGAAMLRGMGWKKGEAIGGVMKGLSTPIVGVPRRQGLGIGATRDKELMPDKRKPKKYVKPGESREKVDMVAKPDADGRVRHMRSIDDELVEAEDISIRTDAYVKITAGPHRGLLGRINKVIGQRVMVKLTLSSEVVKMHEDDLKPIAKAAYNQGRKEGPSNGSGSSGKKSSSSSLSSSKREERPWLCESIQVRIISSKYKSGKYYNKKVNIVDVTDPKTCSCTTDEGKLLEGVRQKDVETIIPKETNTTVKVVQGKHAGRRGKLLEKNKAKGSCYVQLTNEHDARKFYYDEVSQFVGQETLEDW